MYDEMCLDTFLAQQEKLFREPVAESREEAEEFPVSYTHLDVYKRQLLYISADIRNN